jgi:hypothetical protein
LWNDGFKKTKLKAQIIALLILFWWRILWGKSRKQQFGVDHTICRDPTLFVESAVFRFPYPVFQHSTIPSFHAAYQEDDRKKHYNSNRL